MRTIVKWSLGIFLLGLSACVPSVHPLYSPEVLIWEEQLLGDWLDEEHQEVAGDTLRDRWTFTANDNQSYTLRQLDGSGRWARFQVHMVELDGRRYLDFFPEEGEGLNETNDILSLHLFPTHTFAKVEFLGGKAYIYLFDHERLEKLIKQGKIRIRHERRDDELLLTASTPELQLFISKYGHESEAYVDPIVLNRMTGE